MNQFFLVHETSIAARWNLIFKTVLVDTNGPLPSRSMGDSAGWKDLDSLAIITFWFKINRQCFVKSNFTTVFKGWTRPRPRGRKYLKKKSNSNSHHNVHKEGTQLSNSNEFAKKLKWK